MNTLDTYFKLSDTAGTESEDFKTLIALFDPNGIIETADGSSFKGHEAIDHFFHGFFNKNIKLRHVWVTKKLGERYKTSWAVAGLRKDENLISLTGYDIAELNKDHLITYLKVVVNDH